MKHKIL